MTGLPIIMNAKQHRMAEALTGLCAAERGRLARLAALAGTTPEVIWPDVWRYGFDDMEESVRAGIEADADLAAGRSIPHEEVMAEAMHIATRTRLKKES